MADLFVSYASEDRERIRPLVEEFERQGWSVWWDRTLHAGPRFDDEIEKALDAARCVVVAWSTHSLRSDWVRNEASEGLVRRILVPAAIDAVTPPLAFRQNQTAQLVGWPASRGDLDRLLAGVRAVLSNDMRSNDVSQGAKRPTRTNKRRRWWVGAALAAAAAVLLAFKFLPSRLSERAAPRTAVLAFAVPSGDAGAVDLSRAIENEVVETMDAMGLAVISRSGIGALSGTERAARLLELHAEYVLDGDIRREGDNLLVSARIEAPRSSTVLWTNSYRGADANVLRRQIATQLTDTLSCVSSDPTSPGASGFSVLRDDVDSLAMLLRACSSIRLARNDENRTLFRTLVLRYPDSAALNAALAITVVNSLDSVPGTARGALISEGRVAADRAMALDPRRPDAYIALYSVRSVEGATLNELEALLTDGLHHTPDHATLNAFYGDFLQSTGRVAEAQPYLRRGLAGDPLSAAKPWMLAINLEANGQLTQSEGVLLDAAARWPDNRYIWTLRVHLAALNDAGDIDALLTSVPSSMGQGAAPCWRALTAARTVADTGARQREVAGVLSRCEEQGLINKYEVIGIAAALGNIDDAFARTEQIETWRELPWPVLFSNETRPMRNDGRFMPLMQRLGFVDFWRESGHWPDFCRSPGLPYECDPQTPSGADEIAAPAPAA